MWDIGDEIASDAALMANPDYLSSVPDIASAFTFSPIELRTVPQSSEFTITGAFQGIGGDTIAPASSFIPQASGPLNFLPSSDGSSWFSDYLKPLTDFGKGVGVQSAVTVIQAGTQKLVADLFGGHSGTAVLGGMSNPFLTMSGAKPLSSGGGGFGGGSGGGSGSVAGGGLPMGLILGGVAAVIGLILFMRR